jgi:hypothetical protein
MHGVIETSNLTYRTMSAQAAGRKLQRWFPCIVSAYVFAFSLAGAWHIYQAAEIGVVSWIPYPLFAMSVVLIFIANGIIYKDKR